MRIFSNRPAAALRIFALAATAITLFQLAIATRELLSDRVTHEPVVWAAAQAEFELIRFTRLLHDMEHDETRPSADEARLRADLLWSRLDVMKTGRVGAQFRDLGVNMAPADTLAAEIDGFTAALPLALTDKAMLGDWLARFEAALSPMHDLALATNQENQRLVAEEAETMRLLYAVATVAWILIVGGGAALVALFRRAARQAEAASREAQVNEARLNAAINAIPSGFALFDPKDRLVLCNRRFKNHYPSLSDKLQPGVSYEDIARAGVERMIFGDPHADYEANVDAALAVRDRGDAVEQRLADDRWLLAADRRTENGDTVAIRTDITQLKAQEAELLEARDTAEAASQAKSSFIATMSHEIRTPMNGVLGTLELLSTTRLEEKQRLYLTVAEKSARSLLTLLDDLLDLSKIEAGRLTLEESDFPVETVIDSALGVFSAKAAEKSIDLKSEFGADTPRFLRGDVGRLRQVLLNLIGNAVKFTDRGFVAVAAKVEEEDGSKRLWMTLEVSDTGVGIPESKIDGLFQEFNQLDQSYSRKYGGTGLGLAISKKLVELMGGEIGVASRLGEGSRFWMRLPFTKTERRFAAADPLTAAAAAERETETLRILLADDSEVNRMIAVEMLEKAGHIVETAANGVEAVNTSQLNTYDLVLMDVSMPQMDGREATRIIRSLGERQEATPVIAMTAHTTAEDKRKCEEAGMSDFLSKPLASRQLLAMVNKWAGRTAISSSPTGQEDEEDDATPGARPLLDLQTLSELEEDTSAEVIPLLLSAFRTELIEKLEAVEAAIFKGDAEAVAAAAHPLKSSAGSFGCFLLQEVAASVEKLARRGDLDQVDALLPQLKDVGAQSERAIVRYAEGKG